MAAAAAGHCARVTVPSVAFECGAVTSSRVKPACYRCRLSLMEPTAPQKKTREFSRSIQCREFALPRSSFSEQVCQQLYDNGMDERHCSSDRLPFSGAQPLTEKSDLMEQVRDHQSSSREGDAYLTGLPQKEIERRRKIGAANKGKAPWTKGRKLSEEHKQLIKQRTTEALSDPKVMSC